MSAIARENYAFLQSHPACPKQQLQLDEAGRLSVIDAVASAAIQPAVAAACFRARVWGHLIPELKSRGPSFDADSLLAEVRELRKENPFPNPRFKELLDEVQAILEEISPPKSGAGKKLIIPAAALLAAAALVWNHGALSELEEETLRAALQAGQDASLAFGMLCERMAVPAGQVASLALGMLCERMAVETEGRREKVLWRIGAGAGFAGCLAPFVKDEPIIIYIYNSINSSLSQLGCSISSFLLSYLQNR